MGCRLLNTNLPSLSLKSCNSLFPSPNRTPNSLSFPFHFESLQGCNITCAHHLCAPLGSVDSDDYSQVCETYDTVKEKPLTCPLGWWEGHENEDISQIFEDWCKKHGKRYGSDEEKLRRLKEFKSNYEYMRQHNEFHHTGSTIELYADADRFGDEYGYLSDDFVIPILPPVAVCGTIEAWNEQLAKGQGNNKLIVVEFSAEWCEPCELIFPIINELAEKTPQVTFLEVDVCGSEMKRFAERFGVNVIPTVLLMKNGQVVDKVVGPLRDELHRKVAMHASST